VERQGGAWAQGMQPYIHFAHRWAFCVLKAIYNLIHTLLPCSDDHVAINDYMFLLLENALVEALTKKC
jgi:hypothetical protein